LIVIEKENLIRNKDMKKTITNSKKIKTGQMPIDVTALERMKQPGYRRINQGLSFDATPTDKAKHEICQSILNYMHENNLSEKEIGKKLGIKKQDKLEYLLFCHINNFDLDELAEYANKLLGSFELKIVRPGEEVHVVSRSKSNGRTRKHA